MAVLIIDRYIGLFGTGFIQVLYLGRAPRTKETLPDFLKWRRVTRHPLVFRGLTGSQRTPEFGASQALTATSEIAKYTKSVTSVRTSKNWWLCQVLFDVGESPIALFIPSSLVGFLEGGKKGF